MRRHVGPTGQAPIARGLRGLWLTSWPRDSVSIGSASLTRLSHCRWDPLAGLTNRTDRATTIVVAAGHPTSLASAFIGKDKRDQPLPLPSIATSHAIVVSHRHR